MKRSTRDDVVEVNGWSTLGSIRQLAVRTPRATSESGLEWNGERGHVYGT
jgi:hypothetical protein